MFGLSFPEILVILVVALLVLGPTGMPKLARTLGKGLRDLRRATGELRGAFEDEFYKLDREVESAARAADAPVAPQASAPPPVDPAAGIERRAPEGTVAAGSSAPAVTGEAPPSALVAAAHGAAGAAAPAAAGAPDAPRPDAPAADAPTEEERAADAARSAK